jgi:hypothetical protein
LARSSSSVSFALLQMRATKLTITIAAACLVALVWYWKTHLTYAGEVSRFEAKIRHEVNPTNLQSWAEGVLRQYAASNATDVTYEVNALPDYIERLSTRHLSSVVVPRSQDSFIRIIWGSGFRGHWGLHVGSTNFVDPYTTSVAWQPGIYFWRDYRP